jgi:hypothetical protein
MACMRACGPAPAGAGPHARMHALPTPQHPQRTNTHLQRVSEVRQARHHGCEHSGCERRHARRARLRVRPPHAGLKRDPLAADGAGSWQRVGHALHACLRLLLLVRCVCVCHVMSCRVVLCCVCVLLRSVCALVCLGVSLLAHKHACQRVLCPAHEAVSPVALARSAPA